MVQEAAQNPPESQWHVLGCILLLALLTKEQQFSPEVDQANRTGFHRSAVKYVTYSTRGDQT
jgi:hypothetical protein